MNRGMFFPGGLAPTDVYTWKYQRAHPLSIYATPPIVGNPLPRSSCFYDPNGVLDYNKLSPIAPLPVCWGWVLGRLGCLRASRPLVRMV